MKNLGSLVFGAIGACFGLTGAAFALMVHFHNLYFEPRAAIALSLIGLLGAVIISKRKIAGSCLMIAAGIGGILCLHQLFALAGTLLIGAGLTALFSGAPKVPLQS